MEYRVELLGISDFLPVDTIRYSTYNTRASRLFVSLYRLKVVFDNSFWNRFLQHEMAGPIFSIKGTKWVCGICGCEANAKSGPCFALASAYYVNS